MQPVIERRAHPAPSRPCRAVCRQRLPQLGRTRRLTGHGTHADGKPPLAPLGAPLPSARDRDIQRVTDACCLASKYFLMLSVDFAARTAVSIRDTEGNSFKVHTVAPECCPQIGPPPKVRRLAFAASKKAGKPDFSRLSGLLWTYLELKLVAECPSNKLPIRPSTGQSQFLAWHSCPQSCPHGDTVIAAPSVLRQLGA